jgi:hypothetical protein
MRQTLGQRKAAEADSGSESRDYAQDDLVREPRRGTHSDQHAGHPSHLFEVDRPALAFLRITPE